MQNEIEGDTLLGLEVVKVGREMLALRDVMVGLRSDPDAATTGASSSSSESNDVMSWDVLLTDGLICNLGGTIEDVVDDPRASIEEQV